MAFVVGQNVWVQDGKGWTEGVIYEVSPWGDYRVWTIDNDLYYYREHEVRPYFLNANDGPDQYSIDPRRN